jgi:hypothetical protein
MASDTPMTSGYEYPRPFQPQGKAQLKMQNQIISKKTLAKSKKSVISKGTTHSRKRKNGK